VVTAISRLIPGLPRIIITVVLPVMADCWLSVKLISETVSAAGDLDGLSSGSRYSEVGSGGDVMVPAVSKIV